MFNIERAVRCEFGVTPDSLPTRLEGLTEPVVFKGLVNHWPAVIAAQKGMTDLSEYLHQYDGKVSVQAGVAPPEVGNRLFYTEDLSGLNFAYRQTTLADVLANAEQGEGVCYMGSTTLDYCLPKFRQDNDLPLDDFKPLISAWIGNSTRVAAHYDVPDNIACVVGGKRRFVLFAPDQLENLYIGPLDFTPAGQPISLVDFHQPDFERFPRFKTAIENAQLAELDPGDAIFIPSMWWHHVEALSQLNMLVNYWWRTTPAYHGLPTDVLHHAILAIRDLPPEQKQAHKALFDHFVFDANEQTSAHIPSQARGMLGEIDAIQARKLRADLMRRFNR